LRFDLLSLELFVAVCEEHSIARAGDRQNIAASAVSKRISDLEARLRTPLFYRNSKRLELTPAAHTLLHHSRVLMRDIKQMEIEIAHHGSGVSGHVRVSASVSTIIQHLPNDLRQFLAGHAGVRIDLQEGTSQKAVEAVAENSADLGIFGGVMPRPGLRIIPYRSDRLTVLMHADHELADHPEISFGTLAEHDMIGPSKGSYLDSLVLRAASELARPLRIAIRVNGFETVFSMVEAQLGVGLVPEACAARYVQGNNVVARPLAESWALRQWNICVRDGQALPAPVRLLLNHLTNVEGH
jgi:DNA-binding transcriptional LysR family regulator